MADTQSNPLATGEEPARGNIKERILDAAEQLFSEHGFAGTSMRMITKQAGVPLASVNYHFGSKHALMEAVYERVLGPVSRKGPADYLEKQEQAAAGLPLTTRQIVETYIGSALRLAQQENISGAVFKHLIGRAFFAPGEQAEKFLPPSYAASIDRYKQALMRALPHLPEEEVVWRMYYFVGIVTYVLAGKDVLGMTHLYPLRDARDPAAILRRLVPFIVAGMEAGMEAPAERNAEPGPG